MIHDHLSYVPKSFIFISLSLEAEYAVEILGDDRIAYKGEEKRSSGAGKNLATPSKPAFSPFSPSLYYRKVKRGK